MRLVLGGKRRHLCVLPSPCVAFPGDRTRKKRPLTHLEAIFVHCQYVRAYGPMDKALAYGVRILVRVPVGVRNFSFASRGSDIFFFTCRAVLRRALGLYFFIFHYFFTSHAQKGERSEGRSSVGGLEGREQELGCTTLAKCHTRRPHHPDTPHTTRSHHEQ